MNKTTTLLLFVLLSTASVLLLSFTNDNTVLESIIKKLQSFQKEHEQQKLYLHFDKPFYAAGDSIWFKGYLVESSLHELDTNSNVLYVELIDSINTILMRRVLSVTNGVSYGDLTLPDTLRQGRYLIRAYTNYMKNFGEAFFFTKEFSILKSLRNQNNEPTPERVNTPYSQDSIDLQFFPEGGNLVASGSFNRVAFKALGPDGKSVVIGGEIINKKGELVTTFETKHDGMGIFLMNPEPSESYSARVTKPYRINRTYPLPVVNKTGYNLQVDRIGDYFKVVVFSNVRNNTGTEQTIGLIVQSHGKAYNAQYGVLKNNAFFTLIPKSIFPNGISQITLFDSQGLPVAERLIYNERKEESLSLMIRTDTTVYGKRDRVTVYVDASYENGLPAAGNFSITCYDKISVATDEKYPVTINNYLSLLSDLKGNIENPGYYFTDSLPEAKKDLDLLMMVHGWRRFTWKEVLDENHEPLKYQHEKGLPLSGKILRPGGKKAPISSTLKIITMKGSAVSIHPDSAGRFYTDGLQYYDAATLVIQTENEKGKKQPYQFLLDPFPKPPHSTYSMGAFIPFNASFYLKQQFEQLTLAKNSEIRLLDQVMVTAKKEPIVDDRLIGFGGNDAILAKDIGVGYTNILQMLQSRVPGVIVSGNPPNMSVSMRGKEPAILINGMISSFEMINMMSPTEVEMIEVIRSGALMYGANSAINIVLKEGAWDRSPSYGINQAEYPGFYAAREFYSPLYDVPDPRHNLPDKRTTLFWEPMVETDASGKIAMVFYVGDVLSNYQIVIEGITPSGYAGTGYASFTVQ